MGSFWITNRHMINPRVPLEYVIRVRTIQNRRKPTKDNVLWKQGRQTRILEQPILMKLFFFQRYWPRVRYVDSIFFSQLVSAGCQCSYIMVALAKRKALGPLWTCKRMVKKKHRRNSFRTVMPPFESTFVPIR